MSRKNVIVSNVSDSHANPIAELVQLACRFDSEIILESDDRRINAKSIMGIYSLDLSKELNVEVIGDETVLNNKLKDAGILVE